MAVSSAVNTSLRSSMILSSPRMRASLCAVPRACRHADGGRRAVLREQVEQRVLACDAVAAGTALATNVVERAGAVMDGLDDRALPHRFAVADDGHRKTC